MAHLRKYAQLVTGLVLFGVSVEFMLVANLGLDPWDVLHQGVSRRTGVPIGTVVVATSLVVLALWIPLRQRPGIGTVANAILVGLVVDVLQPHLHTPGPLAGRVAYLGAGIVVNGVATGLYIGAGLGPGPRDGLMTGLAGRRGWSLRRVRTCIELTVLAAGWLLGGTVGVATLVYAASIGTLAQFFIARFTPRPLPRSPQCQSPHSSPRPAARACCSSPAAPGPAAPAPPSPAGSPASPAATHASTWSRPTSAC